MMRARGRGRTQAEMWATFLCIGWLDGLFESPAETACTILIDSFEYEQHATDLENGCADERGDAVIVSP